MRQLSLYSAEAREPRVADLCGLLCGPGQAVGFGRGTAARMSVVLTEGWRAAVLARSCALRGVVAEIGRTDEGHPLLRTAFRTDLAPLAARWLRGAVKAVPTGFELDGATLRFWVLAAGRSSDHSMEYHLLLDPHAPDTYQPLAMAMTRAGLPVTLLGTRAGGPLLRIRGRRRLGRLSELIGPVPEGVADRDWPAS